MSRRPWFYWPTWVDSFRGTLRALEARTFDRHQRNLARRSPPAPGTTSREFVRDRLANVPSFSNKYALLRYSLRSAPEDGDFLEFGVYRGATLSFIARHARPCGRVFGFDSFRGLQGPWGPLSRGYFALRRPPSLARGIDLIVGRFEETVGPFARAHPGPYSFVHIDCDLYDSAKVALMGISQGLRVGSVIQFDEFFNYPGWESGEAQALQEFCEATGLRYAILGFSRYDSQLAIRVMDGHDLVPSPETRAADPPPRRDRGTASP